GMATVIGGNAGVNTGNYGIGTESGSEVETGGGTDGNNETGSGADGDEMESGAGGTQNEAGAGTDGMQSGADARADGTLDGTDAGDIIYDENKESSGEMDTEGGINSSSNGAGADKGIGTDDRNDASSERKQYRYEY
ncbi:MAG: hypothetical protein K2N98_03965, partial [Lachnospiraceae bacterium]|nr:hypothetical protein [Lachnospiraceae bacterium]